MVNPDSTLKCRLVFSFISWLTFSVPIAQITFSYATISMSIRHLQLFFCYPQRCSSGGNEYDFAMVEYEGAEFPIFFSNRGT